jgi:competence protein ComEC
MLLTGDATEEVEHALLAAKTNVRADILKVGHHGSRTSSAPEFLDAVRPTYAAISCGVKNKFKHPTPEALDRLSERDAEIHRTDLQGNLRYLLTAESAAVLRPSFEN